jgi:hypothetical protein
MLSCSIFAPIPVAAAALIPNTVMPKQMRRTMNATHPRPITKATGQNDSEDGEEQEGDHRSFFGVNRPSFAREFVATGVSEPTAIVLTESVGIAASVHPEPVPDEPDAAESQLQSPRNEEAAL